MLDFFCGFDRLDKNENVVPNSIYSYFLSNVKMILKLVFSHSSVKSEDKQVSLLGCR